MQQEWFTSINGKKTDIHYKDAEGYEKTICTECIHHHATRIIACVNGCRGIKNPEAVGEVVEALKLVDEIAGTLMDELVGNKAADWGIVNGGLVKVNKALKHIQGFTP